jgi:hypothetical protein
MTQRFVTAFLTTCFENGLSKEAAAQLLQRESLDQELDARPAFAVGYLAKVASFPGQMRAMLIPHADMEKAAGPFWGGLGRLGKAVLWDAPRAAATAGWGALRGVSRAAGATVGPSKVKPSFLTKHPFIGGMGLLAGGIGGTYAGTKWWNKDDMLTGGYGGYGADSFLPPGGLSSSEYEKMYANRLGEHEPSIFDMNKNRDSSVARMAKLREALDGGTIRAGSNDYYDLKELERSHEGYDKKFNKTVDRLDMQEDHSRSMMDQIAKRKADLENQRTAWWAAPRRWAAAASEGDWRGPFADSGAVQRGMDRRIGPLQESLARHELNSRLARDRAKLLRGGATGRTHPPRSGEQLTRDFFPTY